MQQRISVRAIIRKDNKTLLLKRANGRDTILDKFELPGGKVHSGEQPDDAIRRYIKDDTGLDAQTVQLFDAITYTDHDYRDMQYAVIVYLVGLHVNGNGISLGPNYSKYTWLKKHNIQHDTLTEVAQIILGMSDEVESTEVLAQPSSYVDENSTTKNSVVIYSDGGSRGNPGPSAAGYVIMDNSERILEQGGEYLGITTNNQAEYHGVRLGLEAALRAGYRRVSFHIDSMLVVNQLNRIYQIKNRDLWPINERVVELASQFDAVKFMHVKREFNQLADGMVNKILDQQAALDKV